MNRLLWRIYLLLLLLIVAGCGGGGHSGHKAGGGSDTSTPVSGGTYKVSGIISKYCTDEKIGGATINAALVTDEQITSSAKSDANGKYNLDLPSGTYDITATAKGYKDSDTQRVNVVTDIDNVSFGLTPSAGNNSSIFQDNFENGSAWSASGFWHRQINDAAVRNLAIPDFSLLPPDDDSNGVIPTAYSGNYCYWYGQPSSGNFIGTQIPDDIPLSGGISTASNNGTLTSPPITVPVTSKPVLNFMTWFEIEATNPNSNGYDLMIIEISDDGGNSFKELGRLNPASDPDLVESKRHPLAFTSSGFNKRANWIPIQYSLNNYSGKTVILRFEFDSVDPRYNGFRGWFIDDVKIINSEESVKALSVKSLMKQNTTRGNPQRQ